MSKQPKFSVNQKVRIEGEPLIARRAIDPNPHLLLPEGEDIGKVGVVVEVWTYPDCPHFAIDYDIELDDEYIVCISEDYLSTDEGE